MLGRGWIPFYLSVKLRQAKNPRTHTQRSERGALVLDKHDKSSSAWHWSSPYGQEPRGITCPSS